KDARSLYKAKGLRLQQILVARHFELDPVGPKDFARHLRSDDRFPSRAAACGVWQHAGARRSHELPKSLAPARASRFAAQRDGNDLSPRRFDRLRKNGGRGIARSAKQEARREALAVERQRIQEALAPLLGRD